MTVSTSPDLQDYYATERAALGSESLVRSRLLSLGIREVQADYDGVGDSGQFEQFLYLHESKSEISVSESLHKEVEALLYALLELRHDGWENNDGAFGIFRWNLADGTIEQAHHQRFTDYDTTLHHGFDVEPAVAQGVSP